jgi:NAD(P)-dependent dehydrogenase (short-subunit alcohol dehydrogenase family)
LEFSAQGIRVNAVNPAVIDTDMVDRLAEGMNVKKDDLTTFIPSDASVGWRKLRNLFCGPVPTRRLL